MKKVKSTSHKEKVIKKENFDYMYQFTKEELAEKANRLASACNDLQKLEEEKKTFNSGFKYKLDGKSAEISLLSNNISTGEEYITRSCDCEYDFDNKEKIYRLNGMEVGRVAMTPSDYQTDLELTEEELNNNN